MKSCSICKNYKSATFPGYDICVHTDPKTARPLDDCPFESWMRCAHGMTGECLCDKRFGIRRRDCVEDCVGFTAASVSG
jgi:hypothetical protein